MNTNTQITTMPSGKELIQTQTSTQKAMKLVPLDNGLASKDAQSKKKLQIDSQKCLKLK